MKQQSDRVPCDEPAERVAHHAQLLHRAALLLKLFQPLLNLKRDSFPAQLDAIVGEGSRVSLGLQDVEILVGVSGRQT